VGFAPREDWCNLSLLNAELFAIAERILENHVDYSDVFVFDLTHTEEHYGI